MYANSIHYSLPLCLVCSLLLSPITLTTVQTVSLTPKGWSKICVHPNCGITPVMNLLMTSAGFLFLSGLLFLLFFFLLDLLDLWCRVQKVLHPEAACGS